VGTGTALTIDDGRSGRLVAAGDPDSLAAGIRWCLEPNQASERRAAARAHAEGHFSAGRMADAIIDLYHR
jgi:glycosyltransferase involved in cell wall biosynthesis